MVLSSQATLIEDLLKEFRKSEVSLAGTYHGTKSVLGLNIDATVEINSSSSASLVVKTTGLESLTIDCKNEAYSLSGSKINLTHLNDQGDCVHDALEKYELKLKEIDYNSGNDSITI